MAPRAASFDRTVRSVFIRFSAKLSAKLSANSAALCVKTLLAVLRTPPSTPNQAASPGERVEIAPVARRRPRGGRPRCCRRPPICAGETSGHTGIHPDSARLVRYKPMRIRVRNPAARRGQSGLVAAVRWRPAVAPTAACRSSVRTAAASRSRCTGRTAAFPGSAGNRRHCCRSTHLTSLRDRSRTGSRRVRHSVG